MYKPGINYNNLFRENIIISKIQMSNFTIFKFHCFKFQSKLFTILFQFCLIRLLNNFVAHRGGETGTRLMNIMNLLLSCKIKIELRFDSFQNIKNNYLLNSKFPFCLCDFRSSDFNVTYEACFDF